MWGALAVGAAALSIYGNMKAADAQADAARKNAALKRMQAYDLLERSEYNIKVTKQEGEQFKSSQMASFAKSGVNMSGSSLLLLEDTAMKIAENVAQQKKEANQKAEALFMGADIDTQLAGDIQDASFWQNAGIALNAYGRTKG